MTKEDIKITINESTGCHEVLSGFFNQDGHAKAWINGEQKAMYLHRYYYELHKGKIPEGFIVRHTCDNPRCINPEHLILGTHQDNVADRVARHRSATGIKNGRAKLTEEEVKLIFLDTTHSKAALAAQYNVDRKVIYLIKNKLMWKELIETL